MSDRIPDRGTIFEDRADAGRRLAGRLAHHQYADPVVLALPRGGVPVGYEISRALGAPLDVIIARKLGAPGQPELAVGAVAPGGVRVLNDRVVRWLGIPEDWLVAATEKELEEIKRRSERFRGGRPEPDLRDKTVILVDDGIATGMTVRAAIQAVRTREPRRIVLAVPVCARETAGDLSSEVDELVCLETPADLWAIGFWYRDFEQVADEEVAALLESVRAHRSG